MTDRWPALSRTVAIANGKGGVGKTTLAATLAGLAAAAGYHVLIVDLDPQGNVGDDLGYIGAGLDDHGQHLAAALLGTEPLHPVIQRARPDLDVISGGSQLSDLGATLANPNPRATYQPELLAKALSDIAGEYDLIVIDTPPVDIHLQTLALSSARWLLIPTRADTSSIRGLAGIADRVAECRTCNPDLAVLGVVLFDVPSSASRVRADAATDIRAALGGIAPLLEPAIRSSAATAREARSRGLLVHELAERVSGARPFWEALRQGIQPDRLPGTAPALAGDYIALVDAILTRIAAHEDAGSVAS